MTIAPVEKAIRLRVRRGTAHSESTVMEYTMPPGAASSLLDGLRWIRAHIDDTLAFRYSCINANACKECMMRLDGKVVYACLAPLEPGRSYDVEPLPNKPLMRDLVTEIAPAKERLSLNDEPDDD
jgi:succinate dehydrogenase/fumarate reductase-like Fe-S protein